MLRAAAPRLAPHLAAACWPREGHPCWRPAPAAHSPCRRCCRSRSRSRGACATHTVCAAHAAAAPSRQ
eukprot:4986591-Prymnesium_polylepis.1